MARIQAKGNRLGIDGGDGVPIRKLVSKAEARQSQQGFLTVLGWHYQSVTQAGEWLAKSPLKSARVSFTQGPKVMSLSACVTHCDVCAWL